jgi:hypothetical protein
MRVCILAILGVALMCTRVDAAVLEKEIPLGSEKSLDVSVEFGAGEVNIRKAGDDHVFQGRFEYEDKGMLPEITYGIVGDVGELELGLQGGTRTVEDMETHWDLGFTGRVPIDLGVQVGACKGTFDLTGLKVAALKLETGASDLAVLFSAPNEVVLDRAVLKVGAARVKATGLGHANLKSLSFKGGVGSYTLDFDGEIRRSAKVRIDMGVGSLTLRIPTETSAQIKVPDSFLTLFSAKGYEPIGNVYLSPGYGKGKPTLVIDINSGIASITVEPTD